MKYHILFKFERGWWRSAEYVVGDRDSFWNYIPFHVIMAILEIARIKEGISSVKILVQE